MKETSTHILLDELTTYADSDLYPMHMPGHKRTGLNTASQHLPYGIDLTEVPGVDDLHDAEGILKDAMDRTAALYGAQRTWYLVNGSTCGILSAIRAAVPFGGRLIAARNCHRSVWHAIELIGAEVTWAWPDIDASTGLCGSVTPETIEQLLKEHPDTSAVVLTSPTYEGVLSDIRRIADICHENDAVLIVDEAHGAHLGLFSRGIFPEGAVASGADIVIQSPHKTLASMTQTAWLHLNTDRISANAIERQLAVFETSSPSYPLMASLDAAAGELRVHGEERMKRWKGMLENFYKAVQPLQHLRILCRANDPADHSSFFDFDDSKIVILTPNNGPALAETLRRDYQIETEMSFPSGVLAMTGIGDEEEGLNRLANALLAIDATETCTVQKPRVSASVLIREKPVAGHSIFYTLQADSESVTTENTVGKVAAEYLYCYPPGIPLVAPGEVITKQMLETMKKLEESGLRVRRSLGSSDRVIVMKS